MNRGIIVGNHISLISKIVLECEKNKVFFSCCTPLFIEGSILEGKCYKFKLLVPKELFPEAGIRTFHGSHCNECIRLRIYDVLNNNNSLSIYLHINERVSTHCQMYCLEATIVSNVTICNPVLFICGTLIRKHKAFKCLNINNNNAVGIQLFINETSNHCNKEIFNE